MISPKRYALNQGNLHIIQCECENILTLQSHTEE